MRNFNLTLAIIPSSERNSLNSEENNSILSSDEWLRKKSLSTKTIKNYKLIIDCITSIIKDNIPDHFVGKIEVKDNLYYITTENAPFILEIIDDFTSKYKLIIQKNLAQILYVYELKTYNEVVKEINNHLKILTDYLNLLHDNLALVIISEYEDKPVFKVK